MTRNMDQESSQRIARARGRNDSFSKRADMASRNWADGKDEEQVNSSEEPKAEEEGKEKSEADTEEPKSET
ncbi:hypothetical protein F5Y09DRAFT_340794 [Xylaria sp. FL1042]|nr:hypothetical protein F5Y09DRAFT_340794 [Xylaria sp. FL1042]